MADAASIGTDSNNVADPTSIGTDSNFVADAASIGTDSNYGTDASCVGHDLEPPGTFRLPSYRHDQVWPDAVGTQVTFAILLKCPPEAGAFRGVPVSCVSPPWPKSLPDQIQAVRQLLLAAAKPTTAAELAKLFLRGNADRIEEVLQSLVITGNARRLRGGKYVSA